MKIYISITLDIFHTIYRSENQNTELIDQKCLNREQRNLSLGNSAKSESNKEIASGEQVEIRKHCVETESSTIQSEAVKDSKSERRKRKELHLRSDVVNKTLLRAVKRFYSRKFRMLQKSMVQMRFTNVKTEDILDALAEF